MSHTEPSTAADTVPPAPVALTVAGSDSGGGAGIQADLQAFRYFGVFGASVLTAVTAQNPREVTDVHPVPLPTVRRQLEAVFAAFTVGAVKTGMLFSAPLVETVSSFLAERPGIPLVVDPVMVATSGARLLEEDAVAALAERLLPLSDLITPNLPEAEILAGKTIEGTEDARRIAKELHERFGCAVLLKGGHAAVRRGEDVLCTADGCRRLVSDEVPAATAHGTGCALSSAIAACLAAGADTATAVHKAKAYVLGLLKNGRRVGPNTWAMVPPPFLPVEAIRVFSAD